MSDNPIDTPIGIIETANNFDRWQTIAVGIFMALAGYTVMVSVPVLTTALVNQAGFSPEQAGRIWGAYMLGLSAGFLLRSVLCRVHLYAQKKYNVERGCST